MSLSGTPSGERVHIGIFGRRNAGKSSLINALTGQSLAIVSDVPGTTTDPVQKAMELLPLGPVVMIDTPGLDDEGELGELRIRKSYQMLNKTDIALLVVDSCTGFSSEDHAILRRIIDKNIPYLIVFSKSDLAEQTRSGDAGLADAEVENCANTDDADSASAGLAGYVDADQSAAGPADTDQSAADSAEAGTACTAAINQGSAGSVETGTACIDQTIADSAGNAGINQAGTHAASADLAEIDPDNINPDNAGPVAATAVRNIESQISIRVSAANGTGINELRELIGKLRPDEDDGRRIVGDLIDPGDIVVLVVPIDKAAPKGRLILPQQQTIRDILDADASAIVVKENSLKETFVSLAKKPSLVITDSQVFKKVAEETPEDIPFTSFSVLFSRYKGNLAVQVKGAHIIDSLVDGDCVLISEGCTHHRQCGDIGTQKLPALIKKYTGRELKLEFTSGTEFPLDLEQYRLIIHCGGCMLSEREMKYRIKCAADAGVPITNYGTAIAHMNGILDKSLEVFGETYKDTYNERSDK